MTPVYFGAVGACCNAKLLPHTAHIRTHSHTYARLRRYQPQFQRCPHLKNVLLQMHERYGEDLHAIIFVKQRVVAHIVAHYIEADPDLSQVCRPVIAYSSQTRATPTLALSKRDIRENISMFSEGEKNVLVATSVAEEGMDVSAANCVIRFDAFEVRLHMKWQRTTRVVASANHTTRGDCAGAGSTSAWVAVGDARVVDSARPTDSLFSAIPDASPHTSIMVAGLYSLLFRSSRLSHGIGRTHQTRRPNSPHFHQQALTTIE